MKEIHPPLRFCSYEDRAKAMGSLILMGKSLSAAVDDVIAGKDRQDRLREVNPEMDHHEKKGKKRVTFPVSKSNGSAQDCEAVLS